MDEEENKKSKAQDIAETVQAVKDGEQLARNISSGNIIGAAKNAINLAKNEKVKKARRLMIIKMIIKLIWNILKIIVPVLLVATTFFSIFDSTGDSLQNILDSVTEFFTVDYKEYEGFWDGGGTISIKEEEIEVIINSIDQMGISMDGLKLMGDVDYSDPDIQAQYEKVMKEYIRKFYEAQAMTETINTKPNWFQENIFSGGKPYGTVYVHRSEEEENPQTTDNNQLDYISIDEMRKYAEDNKFDRIKKKFSIDENGNLVYAGWYNITITRNGVELKNEDIVKLHYVDYKRVLEQYTTPMNFFFYLAMTAQNPEFVEAVIDLVKQSEIRLMIYDTKQILKRTQTDIEIVEVPVQDPNTGEVSLEPVEVEIVTVTTENSLTPHLETVFAKTWFSEQEIKYKKDPTSYTSTEGNVVTESYIEEYKETLRGDVIDKLGERGDQGIKDLNGNNQVDENEKVDENSTFLGLMDDRFIIPNTTRYSAPGANLISGAEIFFHLLQKDSSTQYIEQIMRYAFYKYTQRSYGVEELNFDLFDAKEFETVGSGLYGNTTEEKLWYALREAGFSEYATAGVISNLWAKSGLKSNHLNDSSEKYVKMTDQEYTDAVNNGTYSVDKFISDHKANNRGAGYGIAEWTSSSSKEGLYYFAQSRGVGIDDEDMQIEYLIGELTSTGGADGFAQYTLGSYKGYTVDSWKNAESAEDAAKAFYWISEKPAKDETAVRVARAEEYYKEYQGKSEAITIPSDTNIVVEYKTVGGRTFTILNQNTIQGWGKKCNRAAAAIIASAYSNEQPHTLVQSMNDYYTREGDPIVPTLFFERYGLERTEYIRGGLTTDEYVTMLRKQLKNGGYAEIYVQKEGGYTGKSGELWTTFEHWVAIIGYKSEGGQEKILIADHRGANWYDIDEFDAYNDRGGNSIGCIALISEKK